MPILWKQEKRFSKKLRFFPKLLILASLGSFDSFTSYAEVRLATPTTVGLVSQTQNENSTKAQDDEEYPESYFGRPPLSAFQVNFGLSQANSSTNSSISISKKVSNKGTQDLAINPLRLKSTEHFQEISLIAGDLGFFPKTLFLYQGVPVRLFVTGASKQALCLLIEQFQVRKKIQTQKIEEFEFTPNESGQFRFYCPINGMEGTFVVRENTQF